MNAQKLYVYNTLNGKLKRIEIQNVHVHLCKVVDIGMGI